MSNSVAKRSNEVEEMLAQAAVCRALAGGTVGMRKAGKTYLPKFEAEQDADYQARLAMSWLFNGFAKTVGDITGRIFAKPIEAGDGIPSDMEDWLDNVDLQGRDLSTFMQSVCQDALEGPGISYVMVDAPPRNGVVTQAEARTQGLRPYFVHIKAEALLGWKTMQVGNVTTLGQIRIMEEIEEPDEKDEFKSNCIKQVRVLDRLPGGVQVRLFRAAAGSADMEWALWGEPFFTGLPEITVVPFYANRDGFFEGEPLLEDLAWVNVAHWQSQSDQRNVLHSARVPILFASGIANDDKIVISATVATQSSNADAKLQWVEHTGKAIEAGRQDLKDLEFQMEAHGLQLVMVDQNQSATGAALDNAKETSTLSMLADALKDATEQALIWMAQYGGKDDIQPEAKVNKEFGVSLMSAQEFTAMLQAVNTGRMSHETFLREIARRGIVAPDLDPAEEMDRIEAEGGGLPAMVDPKPAPVPVKPNGGQ